MSERERQGGDPEQAICHICERRFDTQEGFSKHLMEEHPQDALHEDLGAEGG
jgi:hypothetical protein